MNAALAPGVVTVTLLAKYAGQLERLPLTGHSPRICLGAVSACLSAGRRSPAWPGPRAA